MINKAKKNYPTAQFIHGDANQSILFNPGNFDLITILYFTIYYIKNKMTVFKNCYEWLDSGGYLAIHLVNMYNCGYQNQYLYILQKPK